VHSDTYITDINVPYYIPVEFVELTDIGQVQSNVYYYTIDAKKTTGS